MWEVNGNDIKMAEEDFGVRLPMTVHGTTLSAGDEIAFVLKNRMNGNTILTKTFSSIQDNTFNLVFTEEESELLKVGKYVYRLDWYQDGMFRCNIIPSAVFKVGDKA